MMNPNSKEREVAIEAVWRASRVCQEIRTHLISAETIVKEDRSPVTVADFSSQAIILHALRQRFPSDRFVAEESAADLMKQNDASLPQRVFANVRSVYPSMTDSEILSVLDSGGDPGGTAGRFWTLDPIDGTKGFLRGEQYAISLALIEDGETRLGVLGCPNYPDNWHRPDKTKGLLLFAEKTQGTFARTFDDRREERVHVSDLSDCSQVVFCESVESGHSSHDVSRRIAERLRITQPPVRIDSQCKYTAVARGDASLYLRWPTRIDYEEKIWDHAAGAIVLTEAGGRVTDLRGEPLDFSQGRTLSHNRGIIATCGSLHDDVLEAVREILPST